MYRFKHVRRPIAGSVHGSRYIKLHEMHNVYTKSSSCMQCHKNERTNDFVVSYQTCLHLRPLVVRYVPTVVTPAAIIHC